MQPVVEFSRRKVVTLAVDGNLIVANGLQWYSPLRGGRVIGVSIGLRSLGTTSGATQVDVKRQVGGAGAFTSILAAALSLAYNAATQYLEAGQKDGAGLASAKGEPSGVDYAYNDVFRVDVLAIPGAASAGLNVFLEMIENI